MIASELARQLDRSEATVSRLLSGARQPSVETMRAVKQLLGWSVDEQAESLGRGTYGVDLAERMERQPTA